MSSSPKRLQNGHEGEGERPANPFSPKIKAQKTAKDSETPRAVGLFSTAPNPAAAGKFCVCNSGAGAERERRGAGFPALGNRCHFFSLYSGAAFDTIRISRNYSNKVDSIECSKLCVLDGALHR